MKMKCSGCGKEIDTEKMTQKDFLEAFDHTANCPGNPRRENCTPELRKELEENVKAMAILDEARKALDLLKEE